jgi:hypothetical protein
VKEGKEKIRAERKGMRNISVEYNKTGGGPPPSQAAG